MLDLVVTSNTSGLNIRNKLGETSLYKAFMAGNTPAIKTLLNYRADALMTSDADSRPGISCLHWLFQADPKHMDEVVALAINGGANVNAKSSVTIQHRKRKHIITEHFPFHWPYGTPLHWQSYVGSIEAARALLDHNANIDEEDTTDDTRAHTAIGLAMLRADSKMVELLLERGADPNKKDSRGFTPLHMLTTGEESRNKSNGPLCATAPITLHRILQPSI